MKILELDLHTNNLETTCRFYVDQLGLTLLSCSAAHLTVLIGYTRLTFQLVDQPVASYHLAINIPHNSLDVFMYCYDLDYLPKQASGKTIAGQTETCYFYDLNGNLLEFIARKDLPLNNPGLTLPELFQGVSKIGLATEDVAYTTNEIQRRFPVKQLSKTIPQSDINALGDDNGLFILAKQGRKWLFSNAQVGLNYYRIQFITGSDEAVYELSSYEVNQLPIGYAMGIYQSCLSDKKNEFIAVETSYLD